MAGSSGAIRAGRAFVEIFADDSALQKTLGMVSRRLKSFGASIATAGGALLGAGSALVAPLVGAAIAFAKAGSELTDASGRTGASVEALSELGFAAEQSGASLSDVEIGFRGLAKFSQKVADGSKDAGKALDELGVSASDLAGKSPDEQMMLLGDALSKVDDPLQRAALGMQVFGKSGVKLLPMFADGASGAEAMRKQVRGMMTTEDAKKADELGDALDLMWMQLRMVAITIGAAVAPMMMQFIAIAGQAIAYVMEFVRQNSGLITGVLLAGVVLSAVGAVLVTVGGGLALLGMAVSAVAAVIGFLLSPLGLVLAALVGLGAWLATSTDLFDGLAADATGAFGAIKAALAGGDIGAAAAVAMALVVLEFQKGVTQLTSIWDGFFKQLEFAWLEVAGGISGAFDRITTDLYSAYAKVAGLFSDDVREKASQGRMDFFKREQGRRSEVFKAQGEIVNGESPEIAAAEAKLAAAQAAFDTAIAVAQTTPSSAAGVPTAPGEVNPAAGLGNLGTASAGTFSNMAGRILAGPDSKIVTALQQTNVLLEEIRDGVTDQEG